MPGRTSTCGVGAVEPRLLRECGQAHGPGLSQPAKRKLSPTRICALFTQLNGTHLPKALPLQVS